VICGKCGLPIHPTEAQRHFGDFTAHQEYRCIELLKVQAAAAREEGRREGEAEVRAAEEYMGGRRGNIIRLAVSGDGSTYRRTLTEMIIRLEEVRAEEVWQEMAASQRAEITTLDAAHAAQLVALRGEIRQLALGCLPLGHCTDTCEICETAKHIAYLIGKHPIPDAEAALEKVKEEAVREFLAKEPSGRYRAIPQHCGVWWTFGDDVASEDVALTEAEARAVANALNALTRR